MSSKWSTLSGKKLEDYTYKGVETRINVLKDTMEFGAMLDGKPVYEKNGEALKTKIRAYVDSIVQIEWRPFIRVQYECGSADPARNSGQHLTTLKLKFVSVVVGKTPSSMGTQLRMVWVHKEDYDDQIARGDSEFSIARHGNTINEYSDFKEKMFEQPSGCGVSEGGGSLGDSVEYGTRTTTTYMTFTEARWNALVALDAAIKAASARIRDLTKDEDGLLALEAMKMPLLLETGDSAQ